MKARTAFYVSKSKSSHDERFVEALQQVTQLREFYLDQGNSFGDKQIWSDSELIIASPLSSGVTFVPTSLKSTIIGICLAYEINEEAKKSEKFREIYENVNRCKAIVCDSKFIETALIDIFKFKGEVLRITYGCNQEKFKGIEFEDVGKLRILSTRNWSLIHSNITTVSALRIIRDKEIEFEIDFYGAGEQLTTKFMKNTITEFQSKVRFNGPYSQEDLPRILSNSEIYISSAQSDGASVSLLESMSAGRICITRDFPSNREWIENGKNGFLFTNFEELAEIIISLHKLDYIEKLNISNAAKERVTGVANWSQNKVKLQTLVEKWSPQ